MNSAIRPSLLLFLLLLCVTGPSVCVALEATFTPNPDDAAGHGPLPLSQNQRDQLSQLEHAIRSSPDPQATLDQVAQANNIDPSDLMAMLERNRSDMLGGGGGGPSRRSAVVSSWPQALLHILATLALLIRRMASKHPQAFGASASALLLMVYVAWSVPRTGLVLSTRPGVFSKGHTTLWSPPATYVARLIESNSFAKKPISFQQKMDLAEVLDAISTDGVEWHKMPHTSKLSQAATARWILDVDDYMPDRNDSHNDDDDDDDDTVQAAITDLLFETASDIVLSRRFAEFSGKAKLASSKGARHRSAMLILPNAGDWNGYGLQPLAVTHEEESDAVVSVVYSTLKGGLFDGQLTIRVEQTDDGNVVLALALAVPKKARKISRHLATAVLDTLSTSMATSITTQVRQLQSRRIRSRRFSEHATDRAKERRQGKLEKSIQMEEMAADRRRRGRNPNAGRYRPTGQKMPTSTSPGRGPG